MHPLVKSVIAGHGYKAAPSRPQRVEDLQTGFYPHLQINNTHLLIYWGTKVCNINIISFVVKKTNNKINLKPYV